MCLTWPPTESGFRGRWVTFLYDDMNVFTLWPPAGYRRRGMSVAVLVFVVVVVGGVGVF